MADLKLTKFEELPENLEISLIQRGINTGDYDVYCIQDLKESGKKTLIISLGISPDDLGFIIE